MSGAGARLFFALWPPRELAEALAGLQRRLGEAGRPVPRERLHLTVLFVGDGDPEQVAAAGARAAAAAEPVRLGLDRIGPRRRDLGRHRGGPGTAAGAASRPAPAAAPAGSALRWQALAPAYHPVPQGRAAGVRDPGRAAGLAGQRAHPGGLAAPR
mgnify:CR=1 FL=1